MLTSFPHDHHGQDTRCNSEVEWNHNEARTERPLAPKDAVLCDAEYDDSKSSCNSRCNSPCSKDLRNTFPACENSLARPLLSYYVRVKLTPDDSISSNSGNPNSYNAANDAVAGH